MKSDLYREKKFGGSGLIIRPFFFIAEGVNIKEGNYCINLFFYRIIGLIVIYIGLL
jgi:hypothetical protein